MTRPKTKGARPAARAPQAPPPAPTALVALLLTLSGSCALVYQMVWLREFRLVFGAATPATASVLAVFMGGLGLGSAWLGRRAETSPHPLRSYALLELGVAAAAFASPFLLRAMTAAYRSTGGVLALGPTLATLVHVMLAVAVLGPPCFLMGGTLPMAARAIERDDDRRRGSTGLLYGLNALGGLTGVVLSTFWLLESFGSRGTLLLAAAVNAGTGLVAWKAATRRPALPAVAASASASQEAAAPAVYVYGAAFTTGFVFFLSELVWYRMGAPLLGSSTYSFGILLALALAGIGIGGVVYRTLFAPRRGATTLALFASVSALQALSLVAPYAAGDRLAILSFSANAWREFGFAWLVTGWTLIGAAMVLLPSVLAGVQFPLLVSLLGQGREQVGVQTGRALAWNTAGSIAGSLLGGFVLIPGLGAPGSWRLATGLTATLAASAIVLSLRRRPGPSVALSALVATASLLLAVGTLGPTAVWRHQPWGYGRVTELPTGPNRLRDWQNVARWAVRHEFDGRESSVALSAARDTSFVINGKSDGSAIGDAPTQVMLGLLPAALHPSPKRALVVGLGTGSSAGWLGDVPGIEAVDVVEIEPGILNLARNEFAPVNRGAMTNPKVRTIVGDARELLSVQGPSYDLIVSEPSNPYRAGIASLFTKEYYQAARARLASGGMFAQWVQGYEIDARSVYEVYATLASAFPYVETWVTQPTDLLFVCYSDPPSWTVDSLRSRFAAPPYRQAIERTWITDSVEGVLAHHLASPALGKTIAEQGATVNTDDSNVLEYGFARSATRSGSNRVLSDLFAMAVRAGVDRPEARVGEIDATRLAEERLLMLATDEEKFVPPADLRGDVAMRAAAISAYAHGDYRAVLKNWRGPADSRMARAILLQSTAEAGEFDEARLHLDWALRERPTEAHFAAALATARNKTPEAAVDFLVRGLESYRDDPWVRPRLAAHALALTSFLGRELPPESAMRLFRALERPFSMLASEQERLITRVEVSRALPAVERVKAADGWGRWAPWSRPYLEFRRQAYADAHDPRLADADRDLQEFLGREAAASGH